MRIILGSSSPYRQQILREMGYEFTVVSPQVDEKAIRHDEPERLVLALAEAKGDAVAAQVEDPALLITADQVVTHGGVIREKPASVEEARRFLRTIGAAPEATVSAVCVTHVPSLARASGVDIVRIDLTPLPDEVIERLLEDGEVLYCAGALRIEDPLVAPYIRHVDGTVDSVMGLPKELTRLLLEKVQALPAGPE